MDLDDGTLSVIGEGYSRFLKWECASHMINFGKKTAKKFPFLFLNRL